MHKVRNSVNYLIISLCIIADLFFSVIIGTMLLCAVFLLPPEKIDRNVAKSAETIFKEGTYPSISDSFSSGLDNFTDSLMLIEAADSSSSPVIVRAMRISHGVIDGINDPAEFLVRHYIDGQPYDRSYTYPRYWHGYLVIIRPLLVMMSLVPIRILNLVIQSILFILSLILFLKRKRDLYVIPWMLGYLMLMPVVSAMSLQYSSCYYVIMVATLAIMLLPNKLLRRFDLFVFLNIGIAAVYFDYLTYPIATFGVPMLISLILLDSDTFTFRHKLFSIVRCGVFWCIGYGGMWISKWILASWVLNEDVVADGFSQFRIRTSDVVMTGIFHNGKLNVIAANYVEFHRTPVIYVAAICFVYLIYTIVKNKACHSYKVLCEAIPYFIVGFAPVTWYCFAPNHSAVHTWFTCKGCIVSVLAVFFGLIRISLVNSNKSEVNRIVME